MYICIYIYIYMYPPGQAGRSTADAPRARRSPREDPKGCNDNKHNNMYKNNNNNNDNDKIMII